MIKSELVARLAERNAHLYEKDVEAVVNAILDRIAEALAAGGRVELRDFGTFSRKETAARQARNPRTGARIAIEAKAHVQFKPGKGMQARLNR